MQILNKPSVEWRIITAYKRREICAFWRDLDLIGERKYRIDICLTERSVFIISLVYIQIYKGISLRARRGKKESALSEAGETFHEVARQGRWNFEWGMIIGYNKRMPMLLDARRTAVTRYGITDNTVPCNRQHYE